MYNIETHYSQSNFEQFISFFKDNVDKQEMKELSDLIFKYYYNSVIKYIFVENNGSNYGTPDILNFHRKPFVSVRKQTSEAILKPVVYNGLIVDVQILNAGNVTLVDFTIYNRWGQQVFKTDTIEAISSSEISCLPYGIKIEFKIV